jgi:hypothetical protein
MTPRQPIWMSRQGRANARKVLEKVRLGEYMLSEATCRGLEHIARGEPPGDSEAERMAGISTREKIMDLDGVRHALRGLIIEIVDEAAGHDEWPTRISTMIRETVETYVLLGGDLELDVHK